MRLYLKKPFFLKGVPFRNNIFLAPMAGVTDRAFRLLCAEEGAGLTFSEMISAKGVHYDSEKSVTLAVLDEAEKPAAVQIFGSEPQYIGPAAARFEEMGAALIDINMGCPMPKITKNGDGSALMRDPDLAARVISAAVTSTACPVSVKMRRGYDSAAEEQAVSLARAAEEAGAALITVHGRYRDQLYSGKSDRSVIRRVKETVSVPVIGNGDIITPQDAVAMFEETDCDGIMIGRGCYGNPWIFRRITVYLEVLDQGGTLREAQEASDSCVQLTPELRYQTILRHLRLAVSFKGPYRAVREMRSQLTWYLRGLPGSAAVRNSLCKAETPEEINTILQNYFEL